MEWSQIATAFVMPGAIWLLTFAILAIQVLWLLFFQTRIAAGILDRKFSDYAIAVFAVAATVHYDRTIAVPLITSLYPQNLENQARGYAFSFLAVMSLLSAGVAFHYSSTHVTSFKGRSLLVFPQEIYEKDTVAVRRLWIRIFNLIGLTSMVLVALIHVYIFTSVHIGKLNGAPATVAYIASLVILGFLAQPVRNRILRFPSSLVLIAKLNQIMAQNSKSEDFRRSLSPRRADPISWARGELVYATRMLERLARREDARFGADVKHPAAAIYRAVADDIRKYCNSPKSLEGSLPSSLITTLKLTEGFLITGDSGWRRQLVRRLNVFQADGTPRPLETTPAAGQAARVVRIGARYADRTLIWLQSRWQAILIALALGAFLLGRLDLGALLEVAP